MKTLGQRVRAARAKRKRGEIAKLAGMAYSTLADIENDNTNRCTSIAQLARALGVNPIWLETGKGQKVINQSPSDDSPPISTNKPGAQERLKVSALLSICDQLNDDGVQSLIAIAETYIERYPSAVKKTA